MAEAAAPVPRRRPVKVTKETVAHLMAQVDAFVLDCDGVIWAPIASSMYPKTEEALDLLRKAGKKVLFASNNSFFPPQDRFKMIGCPVAEDEIVVPSKAAAKYLKNRGFTGKAFVIASDRFKKALREEGIDIMERNPPVEDEGFAAYLGMLSKGASDVKAVVMDVDLKLTTLDMNKAANILREDPDCLFLSCASETNLPIAGKTFLGPGYWTSVVEGGSGRKAVLMGKPAPIMVNEFLKDVHQLNLARSAFVGDSLEQDMGIANNCGMKKLLVLTGVTRIEDLDTCDPSLLPDYYIDSVADLVDLLTP